MSDMQHFDSKRIAASLPQYSSINLLILKINQLSQKPSSRQGLPRRGNAGKKDVVAEAFL
jgi:hypothetical protein